MGINIAIDGPGGAGKSTVARAVAKQLGFIYVDTGAIYRAIGLKFVRTGKSFTNENIISVLPGTELSLTHIDGEQHIIIDGEDVSSLIRTQEISSAASKVSAVPEVRAFLLDLQRDIARKNNVIMDGRDVGTVILPNAEVKIFLTANVEVRARRRHRELMAKGLETPDTFERVLKEVAERDKADSERATAPLKPAEDAVLVDTSDMDFEQSVQTVINIIRRKVNV
jgi:cytidylate kinase